MPEPLHPRDDFAVYRKGLRGQTGVKLVPRSFVMLPEEDPAALATLKVFIEHPDVKGTEMGEDMRQWVERIENGERLQQVPSGRKG